MSRGHRAGRRRPRSVVARAFVLVACLLPFAFVSGAGAAPRQAPLTAQSVTITVVSVSPSTPSPTETPADFTVVLNLANNTDQSLPTVTIAAQRGVPIETQSQLDAAIAHPQVPDPGLSQDIPAKDGKPVTTSLPPRGTSQVTFRTNTDIPRDAGICICHNAIYPLYFTAHVLDLSGQDRIVGTVQTYTPAFDKPADVKPMQVSWLWPIVDRPHRLIDAQPAGQLPVFTDDDLATEVALGRLSRVLDVLNRVSGRVPVTVVIDPELIDELAIMAGGNYVYAKDGKTQPGAGSTVARDWLTELRAVLAAPGIEVSFTAYADPDIDSLVRNGLGWTQTLPPTQQKQVMDALGDPTNVTNLLWPVDEALSNDTLNAAVRQGTTSVILNDHSLPSQQSQPPASGLAAIQTAAGPVSALVTSSAVEKYVGPVLSVGGTGAAQLPELVSELAVRAIENPDQGAFLPIVPPRWVDPSPDIAARAILDTSRAFWVRGFTVTNAITATSPSNRGPLVAPIDNGTGLSPDAVFAAQRVTAEIPGLRAMFSNTDASRLLDSLPAAVQRAESAGWRMDLPAGAAFEQSLIDRITTLENGVRIVRPSSGTYTLASNNSPLPVTVENDLGVTVTVGVRVATENGLPGFTATDVPRIAIPANTKVTLHVPTHVERTGRFQVQAILLTPTGQEIGTRVPLSVHSTALGLIGVIITIVAGAVLALALVVRFIRRMRHRGRPGPFDPAPHVQPEPAAA